MAFKKAVVGLVSSTSQAEIVVGQLQRAGILNNNISVVLPGKGATRDFAHEHKSKAPEGAVAGVGAGGAVGGALGLLAGIGALAIPGVGPLIAAGPIMAALSGGAAGAAFGGVTGALVGLGIPEIEAKQYEGKVKSGSILLSVHVEDDEQRLEAERILTASGADDVITVGEQSIPTTPRVGHAAH